MLLNYQKEGKLIPFDFMCNLLIKTIKSNPGKNYLVDGFPRALDQAIYLERNFAECQQIINLTVANDQVLIDRLTHRGLTSGRADDNAETIGKRIRTFKEQTVPVVDYYRRFGKVTTVDANGTIDGIYSVVRHAILPTLYLVIGPPSSGKSEFCKLLAENTYMHYMDYKDIVAKYPKENEIKLTEIIIQIFQNSTESRVIIEGFPQSLKQAQYFFRNCSIPDMVISIKSKSEFCHERNKTLGKTSKNCLNDVELSAKIREYNDLYKSLSDMLKKESKSYTELNNGSDSKVPFKQILKKIQPQILLIKSQIEERPFKESLIKHLIEHDGYGLLNVKTLMKDECDRGTIVGKEMLTYIQSGKIVPPSIVIKMLRKIVFCGHPKYILDEFPDTIEQAELITENLCSYKELYIVNEKAPMIIQKNSKEEIETYLFKNKRLITAKPFQMEAFDSFFKDSYSYILAYGMAASGKTSLCQEMEKSYGYQIIDFPKIIEVLKKKLAKEPDEQVEVHFKEIKEELARMIKDRTNPKQKYIVDGLPFDKPEDIAQIMDTLGAPERIMFINVESKETQYKLFQKKNEGNELNEEQKAKIDKDNAQVTAQQKSFEEKYKDKTEIVYMEPIITPTQAILQIKDTFSPKIILLQHPPNVDLRTLCYNMAIKYELIYIDIQKLIKENILNCTETGKKLMNGKKPRKTVKELGPHCPGLYDETEIYKLIKSEIDSSNLKDPIAIIDGLPLHQYCTEEEDLFELRPSAELLSIEKNLGSVIMVLKYTDKQIEKLEDIVPYKKIELPKVEKKEEAPKEGEEAAAPKEGDENKPKFQPELFQWSEEKNPTTFGKFYCHHKEGPVQKAEELSQFGETKEAQFEASMDKTMSGLLTENGEYVGKCSYIQIKI